LSFATRLFAIRYGGVYQSTADQGCRISFRGKEFI
jgi:hypothetical protein